MTKRWTFNGSSVLDHKGNNVCTVANGPLIAATPDLLAALEMTEATLQRLAPNGSRATQGTRDVIAAAIAKANGACPQQPTKN